jgi:hypothetical protein
MTQSRPDPGPGFQVKLLETCEVVPSSLAIGGAKRSQCQHRAREREREIERESVWDSVFDKFSSAAETEGDNQGLCGALGREPWGGSAGEREGEGEGEGGREKE